MSETKINLLAKSGNKVKIGLPTLCNYDDDDDEEEQTLQPIKQNTIIEAPNKKSGLLGILPPPKANAFIKKEASTTPLSKSNPSETTQPKSSTVPSGNSFGLLLPRTLASKKPIADVEESSDVESNAKKIKKDEPVLKSFEAEKSFTEANKQPSNSHFNHNKEPEAKVEDNDYDDDEEEDEYEEDEQVEEADVSEDHIEKPTKPVLDTQAWLRFCGGKRNKEAIEIKDVNANDILGDPQANLMKQITGDYKPPSNRDYFAGGSRKKHQITYLAFVAKERDQELKNAWSQSKFNRQQAKAKYGF